MNENTQILHRSNDNILKNRNRDEFEDAQAPSIIIQYQIHNCTCCSSLQQQNQHKQTSSSNSSSLLSSPLQHHQLPLPFTTLHSPLPQLSSSSQHQIKYQYLYNKNNNDNSKQHKTTQLPSFHNIINNHDDYEGDDYYYQELNPMPYGKKLKTDNELSPLQDKEVYELHSPFQQQIQQYDNEFISMTLPSSPSSCTNTPTKGKARFTFKEKDEQFPRCENCQTTASWKHDKKRWWCKPCKRAFTPGLTKPQ